MYHVFPRAYACFAQTQLLLFVAHYELGDALEEEEEVPHPAAVATRGRGEGGGGGGEGGGGEVLRLGVKLKTP